jgi:hypothetical protein
MGKTLHVWRLCHPALNSPGHWEDVKRPPTPEEIELSANMPFGEFFRDDGEIMTSIPCTASPAIYRVVEV